MKKWMVTDGNGPEVECEAESSLLAARLYVDDGDWDTDHTKTTWIAVRVSETNSDDRPDTHWIRLDPPTPFCEGMTRHHEWDSPSSLLVELRRIQEFMDVVEA